jgi:hypothetical protein
MKKLIGIVVALSAMFVAMPASAAMIFTLAGTFSGKLTTHLSTTPVVHNFDDLGLAFIGISDGSAPTVDSSRGFDIYSFSLATLSVTDGMDLNSFNNFNFLVAPSQNLIGFSGPQGLLFSVRLPDPFDGTSFYAPSDFSDIVASQAITFGNRKLKLNHVDFGTFVAFDTGAVPEAATWAMFILGFGAIGGTLRRRRGNPLLIA